VSILFNGFLLSILIYILKVNYFYIILNHFLSAISSLKISVFYWGTSMFLHVFTSLA
jgi:hypothetical protein